MAFPESVPLVDLREPREVTGGRVALEVPGGGDRIISRPFAFVVIGTAAAWLAHGMAMWTVTPLFLALGVPPGLAGAGLATIAVTSLVSRLVVAGRIDRGAGRTTAIAGAMLITLGSLAYIAAASLGQAFGASLLVAWLGAVVHGAGFGAMTTATFTIVADVSPPARRGEAIGYFGAFLPIIQGLAATFSFTLVGMGGFGLLFGSVAAAGVVAAVLMLGLPRRAAERVEVAVGALPVRFDRRAIMPVFACVGMSFLGGALILTLPLLAVIDRVDNPGVFFLAGAASGLLGRLVTGRISDRAGRLRVAVPGLTLLAVAAGALVIPTDAGLALFLGAGIAYGIAASAALPAVQALIVDRSPTGRRGTSSAAMGIAFDVGFAGGSIVIGAVVEATGVAIGLLVACFAPLVSLVLLLVDGRRIGATAHPAAGAATGAR